MSMSTTFPAQTVPTATETALAMPLSRSWAYAGHQRRAARVTVMQNTLCLSLNLGCQAKCSDFNSTCTVGYEESTEVGPCRTAP